MLQDTWQRYHQQGLMILAVDLDEPETGVAGFAGRLNLTLPILVGAKASSLGNAYRVRALPTTYFVDADGIIQGSIYGAMTRRDLERSLGKIGVR